MRHDRHTLTIEHCLRWNSDVLNRCSYARKCACTNQCKNRCRLRGTQALDCQGRKGANGECDSRPCPDIWWTLDMTGNPYSTRQRQSSQSQRSPKLNFGGHKQLRILIDIAAENN
jgi:hypothetical protein